MSTPSRDPTLVSDDRQAARNAMTSFIQISALVLLLGLCALILDPFAGIIIWGVILSVAVYPLHRLLSRGLGGRGKLSAALAGWFVCALFASVAYHWTFYYLLALAVVPRDYLQTRLGEPGVQHRAAASHTRATVRLPA